MTNQQRGVETRAIILQTALDLFSENGYDATSVAQICQGAQVSKGAFYHHFASKQELFLALMESWLVNLRGSIETRGVSVARVPETLDHMAEVSGGLFVDLESGFPILLEFWTQASRQPSVWEKAVAPYRQFLNYFTGLMRTGIDEGSFDACIDPDVAARSLTAMVMGLLLQAAFEPGDVEWQEVTQQAISMLINGLRSKS